jgi:hypothetical protein
MLVEYRQYDSCYRLELRTPAKRESKAATMGDISESMTSELDGPKEELVHCILDRAFAAKGNGGGKLESQATWRAGDSTRLEGRVT